MTEFNRMTIVAAAEVLARFSSNSDMEVLEVKWGIHVHGSTYGLAARVSRMSAIAIDEAREVMTANGLVSLGRAVVERAITAPESYHDHSTWRELVAGLRFDGFEIAGKGGASAALTRMLPEDIPGLDFREADSEVFTLLGTLGFHTAKGHLSNALSAFQRGEWSSANGQLRTFYESYLNEIADQLGADKNLDSMRKRDFLGNLKPPFLLEDYNEWSRNSQKPQYVQGLLSRMHLHGPHPGLSEEEDATFRLQISLITARLFLRRFDQRVNKQK